MAALDFPATPIDGQIYSANGRVFRYNATSTSWVNATGTGYTGSIGYTGSQGAGYTGSLGSSGYTGSTGAGYTGSASTVIGYTGSRGPTGYTGSAGYTGSVGYTGSASTVAGYTGSASTVIGYTGSQGIQGNLGYTGSVGYTGSASTVIGYTGSASTVVGYTGSQGIIGYTGSRGYTGSQGYTGSLGYTGSAGVGQTAGSSTTGYLTYAGITKTAGQLDGGTTNPSNVTRLNYDGYFYATRFYGDGSQLSGVSGGVTVTDDTSTNSTRYLIWDDITSGTATSVGVSSTKLYFNPSTGTLNATVFNSLSDANVKENIQKIDNSVEIVNQLEGVSFNWKDTGHRSYGVIAQELEKIIPDLVDGVDKKTVNYSGIIAFLINAIKELDARVSWLEDKNK